MACPSSGSGELRQVVPACPEHGLARLRRCGPACPAAGVSGLSGRWVLACPARGSGTSESWFRHARQVIPECPPRGSGVPGSAVAMLIGLFAGAGFRHLSTMFWPRWRGGFHGGEVGFRVVHQVAALLLAVDQVSIASATSARGRITQRDPDAALSGTSERWFRHARQVVPACPGTWFLAAESGSHPAGDSGVFAKWFWRSRQVILHVRGGSGESSPVVPACPAGGSGVTGTRFCTSESWFRHARQVIPECPACGSGTSETVVPECLHVIPECSQVVLGVAGRLHFACPRWFASPAGDSGVSAEWFWRSRQVILACPAGGSGELGRWYRRVRNMVLARLRDGSGMPGR
uniref:Uncharacterized protein n=1 Tax=Parascaris univalens TaxID=6257 RepID=A0A915AJ36_PARUN